MDAADRLDVLDLYARHAWSMDAGDLRSFADCYLPDGELHDGRATTTGRPALMRWLDGFLADTGFPGSAHVYAQIEAAEAPGGARCRVAVARFYTAPRTTHCQAIIQGAYDDELARSGGRWRFRRKCIRTLEDLPSPGGRARPSTRHQPLVLWSTGAPR